MQAKVLLAGLVAPDLHVTRGAVETQGIPQSRREAFTPVTLPAREREELELAAAHGLTGDTSDTGSALDILTRLHDGDDITAGLHAALLMLLSNRFAESIFGTHP